MDDATILCHRSQSTSHIITSFYAKAGKSLPDDALRTDIIVGENASSQNCCSFVYQTSPILKCTGTRTEKHWVAMYTLRGIFDIFY
jgi:hypothetical protein